MSNNWYSSSKFSVFLCKKFVICLEYFIFKWSNATAFWLKRWESITKIIFLSSLLNAAKPHSVSEMWFILTYLQQHRALESSLCDVTLHFPSPLPPINTVTLYELAKETDFLTEKILWLLPSSKLNHVSH